ncbi:MAG: hypothetical protein HQ528_00440 [Candidatus Marinimicrobia bacterium]|nr:hypothetical protein [Candidatus Neomarinimicrobiota bacterium]
MGLYYKSLVSRFSSFPRHQQLLLVCNELNRAISRSEHWEQQRLHLGLALELIDFILADRKQWTGKYKEICRAREMIARGWNGVDLDLNSLVRNLMLLTPESAGVNG